MWSKCSFREVPASAASAALAVSAPSAASAVSAPARVLPLHTGGAQTTLQDIKLPERAGGFLYKDASKYFTRNRFLSWHINRDTLEVVERSLEVRIRNGHVKWKGSGALLGASVHELPKHILILLASVSSVHRFVFPRPEEKDGETRNSENGYPSVLAEASESQSTDPKHNHIISYYANSNLPAPDTCAMTLNTNGDALYALAGSNSNNNGIVLVRLTPLGAVHTSILRQESIVPRFLAAFRSNRNEKESNCGLAIVPGSEGSSAKLYALGRDCRIRAWCFEKTTCLAVHPLLNDPNENSVQGAQNHVLRYGKTSNGILLGAFLCFASENQFVILKPSQIDQNTVKFVVICNLLGLERYLVDFNLCGNAIWSVWGGGSDGMDTSVTVSTLDSTGAWKLVHLVPPPAPLLQVQTDHEDYLECLFKPGLFPPSVIAKALSIYERSGDYGANTTRDQSIIEQPDIKDVKKLKASTLATVLAVEQKYAARAQLSFEDINIMHKCWSELYSWCVQYLEGWRKPQGLIVSHQENAAWCILLRRGGVSFLRPMETLEQFFLANDDYCLSFNNSSESIVSQDVETIISAASEAAKYTGDEVIASVRNALISGQTPDQIIPEIADQLLSDGDDGSPVFTQEVICSIKNKLSLVKDLPSAILALNQALRFDCDDEDMDNENNKLENIFSSDLGVSLATESLYQIAEIRFSICCNLLILGSILKGSNTHRAWPVSGHTAVNLQAYNALCWLCETTLGDANNQEALKSSIERLALLKLSGKDNRAGITENTGTLHSASVAWWFVRGAGGRISRKLVSPHIESLHWSKSLLPFVHCLGHLMWGVSGGFNFGSWLAGSGRPKLVLSYSSLLESWCEWNIYSREFIKGMALLDIGETKKALSAFLYAGQGASTESFLINMLPQDSNVSRHSLLNYYLKVIKLFELHNAPECIITWAETAIGIADKDDPHLPIFHSLMFRTQLELGQWDKALCTANEHPVREQRDNCLARLVAALGSRGGLAQLISPTAPPTPPALQRLAEQRARTADNPLNHYYNFLYAFHIKRGDMRKAADVMYEQSIRISSELGPGSEALSKRVRCLLAAVNCLSLVPSQHSFLVTPCELTSLNQGDKRNNDGEIIPPDHDVRVIGLDDLRKELHLVTARLKFSNTQPDQLCSETSAEEVASLLSGIGLHTNALSLRVRHGLPIAPALAALASAAASIPYPPNTQSESDAWKWLAENDIPELCIGETSASGAAWKLLRALVGTENDYSGHPNESRVSILNAVSSKILFLGAFIPHWLLSEYKKLDSSSLIRVLVRHGRLAEAAAIGMEALRNAKTHAGAPFALRPICAPLAALDILLAELQHQASLGDIYYVQIYEELNDLLRLHCERVQRASDNLREDQIIHSCA